MSRMNVRLFWILALATSVGTKSQKWTIPTGSLELDDLPFKAAFIEVKPGLFQLDVVAANRMKLQKIINSEDQPRWPDNRRSGTTQEGSSTEVESTTKSLSKVQGSDQNRNNTLNSTNKTSTNINNFNSTSPPLNLNSFWNITIDRNRTKPHYEVTTESEEVLISIDMKVNKTESDKGNNSAIVPLK